MTSTRTILVSTAVGLAALVTLDAATPAHAATAVPAAGGDPQTHLSVDQGQDSVARARCRWVKRIGLVCDTELSTVNL